MGKNNKPLISETEIISGTEKVLDDPELDPKVTIVIVNTNELHHLKRCLPSIFKQNYSNYEVLVVDNASTDDSIGFINKEFPETIIIRNEKNLGYAGANNVGFRYAKGQFIAVLNPDTEVDRDWLPELISSFRKYPKAGLATPKILLMDKPHSINACGNDITYTGLTFCRGLEQSASLFTNATTVSAVSGAAFVIRKDVLDKIGGFDESFFIYYEETDLSLRALLAGYECLFVPTSIVFHKYAFRFSPTKCFYQERNRYYSLLKTFKWPTFLIFIPGFLISEILAWGYSILRGSAHMVSKFRSYIWLVKNRKVILESRRRTQILRKVKDHEIIAYFSHKLVFAQTAPPLISKVFETILNPITFILAKTSRLIIRW